MDNSRKISNAELLSTSYNNLQAPKIATLGDRDPVTGLYKSQQGGTILTRKISTGEATASTPALIRGESRSVRTADVKQGTPVADSPLGFSSFGSVELNKNLWGRDPKGDPVDNVPAFYWFGFIEDSVSRLEVTPSDYQNYNAMASGNVFVRSNESLLKTGAGKRIEIIAGAGGSLLVKLSYFGNLPNALFSVEGRTEVWAKEPGLIKAHRLVTDINRVGFGTGVVDSPPAPSNLVFTLGRGNPGDRSGQGVSNGNFYKLPFDIGSPGITSPITDLPFYYAVNHVPTSVPVAADIEINIKNAV